MGLSARVEWGLELQVFEGLSRSDAAKRIGMSYRKFSEAWRNPIVRQHYARLCEALRTVEQARNLHRVVEIRDQDKNLSAAIAAVKLIIAKPKGMPAPDVTMEVLTPGYIVDYEPPAPPPYPGPTIDLRAEAPPMLVASTNSALVEAYAGASQGRQPESRFPALMAQEDDFSVFKVEWTRCAEAFHVTP